MFLKCHTNSTLNQLFDIQYIMHFPQYATRSTVGHVYLLFFKKKTLYNNLFIRLINANTKHFNKRSFNMQRNRLYFDNPNILQKNACFILKTSNKTKFWHLPINK